MEYYMGDFKDKASVESNFSITLDNNDKIIFAEYTTGNYEGSAWVIFSRFGQLYEVHSSHCSCYGLEGTWSPEKTSPELILERLDRNGHRDFNTHGVEEALKQYQKDTISFDIDSLPDAKDLKALLNINKLVENKQLLNEQDQQLKAIQQELVSNIKEAIVQETNNFVVNMQLVLSDSAMAIKNHQPEIIQQHVADIFKETEDKLNNKGYSVKFEVNADVEKLTCSFSLKLEIEKKKSKTKKA